MSRIFNKNSCSYVFIENIIFKLNRAYDEMLKMYVLNYNTGFNSTLGT